MCQWLVDKLNHRDGKVLDGFFSCRMLCLEPCCVCDAESLSFKTRREAVESDGVIEQSVCLVVNLWSKFPQ